MRLRILLADERPVLLDGLQSLLRKEQIEIVASTTNAARAVELAGEHHPDITIIGDSLLVDHGVRVAGEIHKAAPHTRIIVLGESDWLESLDLLSEGISGYIEKTEHPDALLKAIHHVSRGAVLWGPNRPDSTLRARQSCLSPRERDVLKLIAEGRSVTEAAVILRLRAKTVAAHRTRLMNKLNIRDDATLVRYAIRTKIVDA
jgi:two-component system, NarL family, response regulator NreC